MTTARSIGGVTLGLQGPFGGGKCLERRPYRGAEVDPQQKMSDLVKSFCSGAGLDERSVIAWRISDKEVFVQDSQLRVWSGRIVDGGRGVEVPLNAPARPAVKKAPLTKKAPSAIPLMPDEAPAVGVRPRAPKPRRLKA